MPAEYGQPLSNRELEIVALVAEGLTNREVAERLFVSHNTVKVHLRNVFAKTGVASRTELTVLAVQEGWITVPGIVGEDEAANAPARAEVTAPEPQTQQPAIDHLPFTPLPNLELPQPEPWPAYRWVALVLGLMVGFLILFLPRGSSGQAITTNHGILDEKSSGINASALAEVASWMELPPLSIRRGRLGVAALEGKIYAIGGITDEGITGRLDIYTIETQTWSFGTSRPVALANIGATPLQEWIIVPGGCDATGQPSSVSHLYDPKEDIWEEIAPLPQALCAYALTSREGEAYLLGGWDGARYRALAYVYDLETNTWQELPPPVAARGFGGAAIQRDHLYYVGGYDDQKEWDICEVYLVNEDRWQACAPLLQPRGGLSLVATGERLYAVGGGWSNYLGFNERYTPNNDAWTVIETPLVGEWRNLGAVFWDTTLYAVGGRSGDDYLNRTYALEVMPWRIFIPITQQN